jgi:polyisoprenoid-binding protein YceI
MLWNIDTSHASASFSARHMMISTVRGSFTKVTGAINFDPANVDAASVEVTIEVASMGSTGFAQRDQHLLSPDFLDAANFPVITFKSTKVESTGEGKAKITGDLTIRDVTKSVVIDAELIGVGKNPFGGQEVAGFTGTTKINREDFGLNWNVALETGGWLVGKEIQIGLDVEAVAATQAQPA